MLSPCQNCQFCTSRRHHSIDIGCAIAPAYWEIWNRLQGLSVTVLEAAPIEGCRDYEQKSALRLETRSLTLSRQQWEQLYHRYALPLEIRRELQAAVDWTPVELGEVIFMMPVESSMMVAIGYQSERELLQVDFINGSRYHYFGVPRDVFENFAVAESKGRFLNSAIKGVYSYERIH